MERYFPVISKSTSTLKAESEKDKQRAAGKYEPYKRGRREVVNVNGIEAPPGKFWEPLRSGATLSHAALTKHVLSTLKDESNPITHSDIAERSDQVYSMTTGHQVAEGRGSRHAYISLDRKKRNVQIQANATSTRTSTQSEGTDDARKKPQPVLHNVCVYLNGYLENTTDIEMKRIITEAGGEILYTPSSACTHIVTSQHLSGSKTHKILSSKPRNRVHVVKPEWILDSIKQGRKLSERNYVVIRDTTTKSLTSTFKTSKSK
ncbi:BRCT domain-containing protein [Pluteus cervinus]|uniref:BRCT domain-containing protein n=1 Tax=Pluteus cervinus TaxID=181527 RepID=A0ACD3BD37_9AGAR|nr:BRCT domain-containing protein [Pluteus cervinus]